MRDIYREWSYHDRCDARDEGGYENRRLVDQWDRDSESSDRAWENCMRGGDFSDPDPDGRFH